MRSGALHLLTILSHQHITTYKVGSDTENESIGYDVVDVSETVVMFKSAPLVLTTPCRRASVVEAAPVSVGVTSR
jgi:hypothetical protein